MPEEIITSTTVAMAVGGFAAKEFFTPALKRMGEGFADLITERVRKVFKRTDEVWSGGPIDLQPGFLKLVVERVSYSDDDEDLTERWAHLLADAARAFSNKHVNYVDILSQLGPLEVVLLDQLAAGRERSSPQRPSNLFPVIRAVLAHLVGDYEPTPEGASAAFHRITNAELPWPGVVVAADIPYPAEGDAKRISGGVGRGWDPLSVDILIRQRLLEEVTLDLQSSLPPANARLLLVTGLGIDFVRACKGIPDAE
jgi:hypothetical protein